MMTKTTTTTRTDDDDDDVDEDDDDDDDGDDGDDGDDDDDDDDDSRRRCTALTTSACLSRARRALPVYVVRLPRPRACGARGVRARVARSIAQARVLWYPDAEGLTRAGRAHSLLSDFA